jgi:hypothetical protein
MLGEGEVAGAEQREREGRKKRNGAREATGVQRRRRGFGRIFD